MKKKYKFLTSLIMLVGISLGMLMSYSIFVILLCNASDLSVGLWIGGIFGTIILPTIIPFTNGNRFLTVVILDEKGVTQKLFGFIKLRVITWEELLEIRLAMYMGPWIFFSKRPINNMFYDDIVKRKDVIQIGYSPKLIDAIREYTDKEIFGYDDDSKE